MRYGYFPGCKIPYYLPQYGLSVRAVLGLLGVELVDFEWNCCGYPIRHLSVEASFLSAARNMALIQQQQLDMLTPCMCCYGNFKHARYRLRKDRSLRRRIRVLLSQEGLSLAEDVEIKHFLTVLAEDIGIEKIRTGIKRPLHGLKVAAHYGCHALRPSEVVQLDNPLTPRIFENLIEATGAESVDWARRLECCGNPLWEKNNALSLKLMHSKIEDARHSGAQVLCTACTYCQIQFDSVRRSLPAAEPAADRPRAVLYSELLGISLGLEKSRLGLEFDSAAWMV